jgi:hypothetical protein
LIDPLRSASNILYIEHKHTVNWRPNGRVPYHHPYRVVVKR